MNEKLIQKMALENAVLTVISSNDEDLSPEEIFETWSMGGEPDGVLIWEPFEYGSPQYLWNICDGFRAQFERYGRELLEEASK